MNDPKIIRHLNYLVKTYEEVTRVIAKTKQRRKALFGKEEEWPDTLLKGRSKEAGLETVKVRSARDIEKELVLWDIWEQWLKHVPGIGPAIAGRLILLYYYKFIPACECGGDLEKVEGVLTCKACGKDAKGGGLLNHRIDRRDFPTISKWWAFMGRHTVDGIVPKRKWGVVSNWSTVGRVAGFFIGDQFTRQKEYTPYGAFLLERKAKHARNHPEWSKGHIHNAAKNEAVKLFLSHFWVVAHEIEGLPVSEPYAGAIMGHTNIVKPFFWESQPLSESHEGPASQDCREPHRLRASQTSGEPHKDGASYERLEAHTLNASQASSENQGVPASGKPCATRRKKASHSHNEPHVTRAEA